MARFHLTLHMPPRSVMECPSGRLRQANRDSLNGKKREAATLGLPPFTTWRLSRTSDILLTISSKAPCSSVMPDLLMVQFLLTQLLGP